MTFSTYWNGLMADLPHPHFLQTYEWGQLKAQYGWQPLYLIWNEAGFSRLRETAQPPIENPQAAALVLKRTVTTGGLAARLCLLYCPKGPNFDWENLPLRKRVLDDLERFARQQGGIFLKLDPDVRLGSGLPGTQADITEPGGEAVRADLIRRGWRFSEEQVQFRNTVLIDLSPSAEELLAGMKQKARYNVRLAAKKGVTVRVGNSADWPLLYRMYAETATRDGFVIRDERYYRAVWSLFQPKAAQAQGAAPLAEPLIAEVGGQAVAAVYLFTFAGRAYYVYGMSREAHREKMPNALLQWEAIRWAKARGCTVYDLWGAPEVFDESDALWGVFRFKEGLGGQLTRTLGAWDYIPNRLWHTVYTQVTSGTLAVMRWLGRRRTARLFNQKRPSGF